MSNKKVVCIFFSNSAQYWYKKCYIAFTTILSYFMWVFMTQYKNDENLISEKCSFCITKLIGFIPRGSCDSDDSLFYRMIKIIIYICMFFMLCNCFSGYLLHTRITFKKYYFTITVFLIYLSVHDSPQRFYYKYI